MEPDLKNRMASRAKIAIFVVALLVLAPAPRAIAQSDENFHQEVALVPGGSAVIENGRGDVSIEGWDKGQMVVDARKIFEGADRERWMRETKIRVEGDEHHRVVKVEYPNDLLQNWGGWRGWGAVNLTIHLPRQVNAELKTDRGRLTVQRIAGKLDIGSDRCNIDIGRLDGELRVRSDRGDLKVRESAIRSGIRLSLDRGSADIELQHFAGDSDLQVSRGDITLTLPKNAAFLLDAARTRRSSFRTDFAVLARGSFAGDNIRGDVNGGGPTLRLRADRGGVSLHAGGQKAQ